MTFRLPIRHCRLGLAVVSVKDGAAFSAKPLYRNTNLIGNREMPVECPARAETHNGEVLIELNV